MTVRISADFRTLDVGRRDRVLGCTGDAGVRAVAFMCPRFVDGTDMQGWRGRVHYTLPDGTEDRYEVVDAEATDDRIDFTWRPSSRVFEAVGKVEASVEFARLDGQGNVVDEFNTCTAQFEVLETLETDPFGPRLVDDGGHYIVLGTAE